MLIHTVIAFIQKMSLVVRSYVNELVFLQELVDPMDEVYFFRAIVLASNLKDVHIIIHSDFKEILAEVSFTLQCLK